VLLICALFLSQAIGQDHTDSADEAFSMEVADRFRIAGGGVVITGVSIDSV
jgi:hypothetical protein